jgi:nitrate/TMAO reductase-like tetraheme cytochrome c subunit
VDVPDQNCNPASGPAVHFQTPSVTLSAAASQKVVPAKFVKNVFSAAEEAVAKYAGTFSNRLFATDELAVLQVTEDEIFRYTRSVAAKY